MDTRERQEIYDRLQKFLAGYASNFEVHDDPGKYSVWSTKPMTIGQKTWDGQYFAGLRELKNFVGFYFMPVYVCPELVKQIPESLTKIFKGKSCFNVKKLTPEIEEGLKNLMELGMKTYRQKGWL